MKNFKKFSNFLSVGLILSVVLGNVSLPVFAFEKNGVAVERVRTNALSDNSGAVLNKINSFPKQGKGLSPDPLITKKENAGLKRIKEKRKDYVEGEILVKYKNNKINLQTISGRTNVLNFIRSRSLEKKEDLGRNNISVLRIKDTKTVEEKIAELKNDPNVEYVEPNYLRSPQSINTNDVYRDYLWGLDNTGQTVNGIAGTPDADIDALEAWAINEGTNGDPIVAVIDTGVAYNHPDLIENMWDGTNCKDENGALIQGGCNHGYDYVDNDPTPLPDYLTGWGATYYSHGTHIAGIIAAVKNNSKGVIGVAPHAKIMALRYYAVDSVVKGIDFAIQNGAKIINASFGGPNFSQTEYDAINRFKASGGIFIAGAGNDATNNDSTHFYPSGFDIDNIISVAATDSNDVLADFSNYGVTSVDVAAPGGTGAYGQKQIYSTVAESQILHETFEGVTAPAVPTGWVKGGTNNNWETYDIGGVRGKVLYGDLSYPYANNTNTIITSPVYNLGGITSGAALDFWTTCDTEYTGYSTGLFYDYMSLEYSSDGTNFSETLKWDEPQLDLLNGNSSDVGSATYHFKDLLIPSSYLTSNFKLRLRWVTDPSLNNYAGCFVDDIKITKYSDGSDEQYGYRNGTSMATPHVAGLAALVWGYRPDLTYSQVKDTILTTGDDIPDLNPITGTHPISTGKRINAYNALNSLGYTISGAVKYYDGVKVIPSATVILENGVGAQLATTTTDTNGVYQFTGIVHGSDYVVRVSKNDNASGLSSADQIKIGRHIVGLEPFDVIYKTIASDVNRSGGLSSADQIKIGRFIVGLDSSLPSGAWTFYSSSATLTPANYLTVGLTRTYTNVTADMINQDFVGIKMGDVNNSWINSVASGTLTTSVDSSAPVSGVIVAGKTGMTVGVFKFVGASENTQIRTVKIGLTNNAMNAVAGVLDPNVAKVYLYEGDTKLGEAIFSSSVATFDLSSLNFVVDRLGNPRKLTVKVDTNTTTAGAILNSQLRFVLMASTANQGAPLGLSSGAEIALTAVTVATPTFYVRKNVPKFTKTADNTTVLSSGSQYVLRFAISADPGSDIVFRQGTTEGSYVANEGLLAFTASMAGTGSTTASAQLIKLGTSETTLDSTTTNLGTLNTAPRLVFNFKTNALTVSGGETVNLAVSVNTAGLGNAGNSYGVTLSADASPTNSATVGINPGDNIRWNDDSSATADYNGFGLGTFPLTNTVKS